MAKLNNQMTMSQLNKVVGGAGGGTENETVRWVCPDCPSVAPVFGQADNTVLCPNCGKPMIRVFMDGGDR